MKVQVEITADSLRIRGGPSTSFPTVGYLKKGDRISVKGLSDDGAFYEMFWGQGWIGKKYTKVIKNEEEEQTPASPVENPKPEPEVAGGGDPVQSPAATIAPPVKDYARVKGILVEGDTIEDIYKTYTSNLASGYGIADAALLGSIENSQGFPPTVAVGNVQWVDYAIDYSYLADNLDVIRGNLNIVNNNPEKSRQDQFDKFNRFKTAFPDHQLSKSFSYVFFTRPDLNIFDNKGGGNFQLNKFFENDPTFYYLSKSNPRLLLSLTRDFSTVHDFHPYLSNAAESFELSDEYLKTVEHGETLTGYKIQYGRHNIESNSAGTFSVSYTDDIDFSVYKTHKAWIDYIAKVYRGVVSPRQEYIPSKILDYATSAYYFICGPDGETVLFWAKYFGVFPTNTPSSSSSWSKGSMVKMPQFNINYSYAFKEDFNPLSLAEFNMNSSGAFLYRKTYEPALLTTGKTFSGAPFVESSASNDFKLRFRKF